MKTREHTSQSEQSVLGQRVDALLGEIMQRRPGLQEWWTKYQNMNLEEYAQTLLVNSATPLQPRDDVADVIRTQANILGKDRAERLAKQILETPVVITANHHTPDFIGLTRQGVGILALAMHIGQDVIVMACGAVPQNNIAHPRGIPLARSLTVQTSEQNGEEVTRETPVRVNILPDSQREALVNASGIITTDMISGDGRKNKGALGQVDALLTAGSITVGEAQALKDILEHGYLPAINDTKAHSLSDQFTLINEWMWQREFSNELQGTIPGLAYLELEGITGGLLEKDLTNPNSLAYQILFDPQLRNIMLKTLDGVDSCWNTDKLNHLSEGMLSTDERIKTMGGAGTMFFTGIDSKGRRVPLNLVNETSQNGERERRTVESLQLKGVDKSGNSMTIPFTPEALMKGLQERKIVPSVFTDFVMILSRGLRAHGGFNQGNYYPQIKSGIIKALEATGRQQWANILQTVQTDNLTAGLMFAVAHYNNGVKPAGGVELFAQPITLEDYEKMKHLTVREAFLFGAPGMYRVVCPETQRKPELLSVTENDIYQLVGDKYVARKF